MSYYQVDSWNGTPAATLLKEKGITFFGGNEQEAHLNIPDDQFVYCLSILKHHFDVMIVERTGKTYFLLDTKNKTFRQR